jgi:hypothetical protein
MQPELRALERELVALRGHPKLEPVIDSLGDVRFGDLDLHDIAALLGDPIASLFLLAAADLNRTALRARLAAPEAQLVAPPLRRAYAVRGRLPVHADFSTVVELALQRRAGTLGRNANAATETLFRDRLEFEGLPIRMRGAWTAGLLVDRRKPDGVFPDPATGEPPRLYLEIKKVNRVRDDIQKRLYENAEVSLEVKFLYGRLQLSGLDLPGLLTEDARPEARRSLREQITRATPAVVAPLICRAEELDIARRYRPNAEAFIDRLFFADEIETCLEYLADVIGGDAATDEARPPAG